VNHLFIATYIPFFFSFSLLAGPRAVRWPQEVLRLCIDIKFTHGEAVIIVMLFFLLCFGVAQALDLIRGFGYAGQGSHGKLVYDPLKFNICLPSNSTVTEYMKRLQICEGYTYLNVFIFIYYYQLFYYYYYYCYYYYQ